MLLNLPRREFKLGEWDCYYLAKWVRSQAGLNDFPDMAEWHSKEVNSSEEIVKQLKSYCVQTVTPIDLDLVLLKFADAKTVDFSIGTLYQNKIYFMSVTDICLPVYKMGQYIVNFWHFSGVRSRG